MVNYTIIEKDIDARTMSIYIPEEVVNKLERSQDEYTRKIGDCSIILTDLGKSMDDKMLKLEVNKCKARLKVWIENKNYIRDTFVLPAIAKVFGYDNMFSIDANWTLNYDRNNKVVITDIRQVNDTTVMASICDSHEDNWKNAVDKIADADYAYTVYTDIYKDICDRNLVNESNYDTITNLDDIRDLYSKEKSDNMDTFYTTEIYPKLTEKFGFSDDEISKFTWNCEYLTGKVTITMNKPQVQEA